MKAAESPNSKRRMSMLALEELKRREEVESLRKYLVAESCFPAQKDPATAPITMEELKKLARVWKLNERRDFRKTNTSKEDFVALLIHHATQNKNAVSKKLAQSEPMKPSPPSEIRPSSATRQNQANYMRNFFGLNYFNRENNAVELLISSRFFTFPATEDNVTNVIDRWRSEDFYMKDETLNNNANNNNNQNNNGSSRSSTQSNSASSTSSRHITGIRSKVRLVKQRNLAMHLMNYSASLDFKKSNNFNVKTVQTFINVSESDDPKTVSHCMIAISNIAADPAVRSMLFEINAVHKITNMLQHVRGKAAHWAAALLFYYLSIDKEAEDRVYNAGAPLFTANGSAKDQETRLVALYTLNNLMPCIDRQRVAETIMRILFQHFDPLITLKDKSLATTYLTIALNMTWFSNAHTTLFNCNILELLQHFATYAGAERVADLGLLVAKILISFLQLPEQASTQIDQDFTLVLIPLIHDQMPDNTLLAALKASVVMSSVSSLRKVVRGTALTSTIAEMVMKKHSNLTNVLAKEVAKYFCNITIIDANHKQEDLESNVEDKLHEAVFVMLRSPILQPAMKSTAIRSLQNLVSIPSNALKLVNVCIEPVVKFLKDSYDIYAAQVLYNLSCLPDCRTDLVEAKVHLVVLDLFQSNREQGNTNLKSVFLQILVQLSSSQVCVSELLKLDLITKLENQLKTMKLTSNWKDISLMLLAVVAYSIKTISEEDLHTIVKILRIITVAGIEEEIIGNVANIVKFISGYYANFQELNSVILTILDLGDSEDVIDSVSTILYNMTCSFENVQLMLHDATYLNVMIRLMRSGKAEVQENIIQSISTLCAHEACSALLLKYDILSDLIVIALLRTNSEDIKVICSQAFYNMLCHEKTRHALLQGDLWWALMRLGRSDSHVVQTICIKALADLSYLYTNNLIIQTNNQPKKPSQLILALRKHHILSFMKDLTILALPDELCHCIQILHNLLTQFVNQEGKYDFSEQEIIAAIRISADAMVRASDLKTMRIALLVLLKSSQQSMFEKVYTEFLNIDIVELLKSQRKHWNLHPDCRLNVSRLLYELSKSKTFTKATSVSEINTICMAMMEDSSSSESSSKAGSLEIVENLAAMFLHFIVSESTPPADLVCLSIWPVLLKEGISSDSSVVAFSLAGKMVQFNAPLPGRRGGGTMLSSNNSAQRISTVTSPNNKPMNNARGRGTVIRESSGTAVATAIENLAETMKGSTPHAFRVQGITLTLLAYTIEALLASSAYITMITPAVLQGLLKVDLVDHVWTRHNLLCILHAVSHSAHCVSSLLMPDIFLLLLRFLNSAVGTTRQEKSHEFAACFLRNIVLHSQYVNRLVAISHPAVNEFVREVCGEVESLDSAVDIAIFFFHTANYLVQHENNLNPKLVLDMIAKLTASEKLVVEGKEGLSDATINLHNINKYTLSMILNKYSFNHGVDPSFIQNMLTYMQSTGMAIIPDLIRTLSFKSLVDWKHCQIVADFIHLKESVEIDLLSFSPENKIWQAKTHTACKFSSTVVLKFTQPTSIVYEKIEMVEALPNSVFTKIANSYDTVMDGAKGEQQTITEGESDEEGGEEEDEEGEEESVQSQKREAGEAAGAGTGGLLSPSKDEGMGPISEEEDGQGGTGGLRSAGGSEKVKGDLEGLIGGKSAKEGNRSGKEGGKSEKEGIKSEKRIEEEE